MSREEWFDLPWYEVEVYLEGLRDQGLFGSSKASSSGPVQTPQGSGAPARKIDLASADLSELEGFTVRRAG